MQVCYYRDKNSINKFQIAKVTADGIDICEPFALETNWDLKVSVAMLNPECIIVQLYCTSFICRAHKPSEHCRGP